MKKIFVIKSARGRMWELLMKAILRCLPMERLTPISDNTVSALLKVKLWFISIPMDVTVVTADIVPDESVVTYVHAKGMGGLMKLTQKFTFILKEKAENETEVSCEVTYSGKSFVLTVLWVFLAPMIKGIAKDTFLKLEDRLTKWA